MKKFIYTALILLMPGFTFAAVPSQLQVYTTWGDFNSVVMTFEKIALMMSDSSYKGLFFSAAVVAIVLSGLFSFFKGIKNPEEGFNWLYTLGAIILGVALYHTFIRPTSTLVVYDETYNQQKSIGNVPDGLILLAGLTNKIGKGFVDIIWTAGDPRSYRENAGGEVFNIIKNVFNGDVNIAGTTGGGQYIKESVQDYIKKCVLFEMNRPNSTIDLNDFYTTTDFRTILSNAQTQSRWMVWKDDTNRAGTCVTCTQGWQRLNAYFNSLTTTSPVVQRFYSDKCAKSGIKKLFGATGPEPDTICRTKVTNFLSNQILGSSIAANQIVIQKIIAEEMYGLIQSGDAQGLANRKTGVAMKGMANAANEWIPTIRGMVFSIFIGLFPFLALFLVTPLFSRALLFMFGSFVFLVSWGVTDALIHSFTMDQALSLFDEVASGGLGIKSLAMYDNQASKSLDMFGAARWSSMMIAGVLSTILVRFGGNAMAHFASQMSSPSSIGSEAQELISSPDQRAIKLSGLESSVPVQTLANNYGFDEMSRAKQLGMETDVNRAGFLTDSIGGGDTTTTAQTLGMTQAKQQGQGVGRSDAYANVSEAKDVGTYQGIEEREKGHATGRIIDEFGPEIIGSSQENSQLRNLTYQQIRGATGEFFMGDGTIPKEQAQFLEEMNSSPKNREILAEQGQGIKLTDLSEEAAENFNKAAHKAGFDKFKAQPGDSVIFDVGYENGAFNLTNITSRRLADRTSGTGITEVDKWETISTNSGGLVSEYKSHDGDTVFKNTQKGSSTTEGNVHFFYDDYQSTFKGGAGVFNPITDYLSSNFKKDGLSDFESGSKAASIYGSLQGSKEGSFFVQALKNPIEGGAQLGAFALFLEKEGLSVEDASIGFLGGDNTRNIKTVVDDVVESQVGPIADIETSPLYESFEKMGELRPSYSGLRESFKLKDQQ